MTTRGPSPTGTAQRSDAGGLGPCACAHGLKGIGLAVVPPAPPGHGHALGPVCVAHQSTDLASAGPAGGADALYSMPSGFSSGASEKPGAGAVSPRVWSEHAYWGRCRAWRQS